MPKQVIVCYMPVLHRGYIRFFDTFKDAEAVYVIDRTTLSSDTFDYLRKDLRQLTAQESKQVVTGLQRFANVQILSNSINLHDVEVVMPDEDVSREVAKQYGWQKVIFYNTFLRWDRRSLEHVNADIEDELLTDAADHVAFMNQAVTVSTKSTDIWRRVGSVLVDAAGNILDFASNIGESTLYSPWIEGDPRNIFKRGVGIEMSVFSHAEATLIARAAQSGTSLQDARIYVTDFPCPACAKLIAHSGITHVYYKDGYAVLDGKRVMDDYGVTVTKVSVSSRPDDSNIWVPYTKS